MAKKINIFLAVIALTVALSSIGLVLWGQAEKSKRCRELFPEFSQKQCEWIVAPTVWR